MYQLESIYADFQSLGSIESKIQYLESLREIVEENDLNIKVDSLISAWEREF